MEEVMFDNILIIGLNLVGVLALILPLFTPVFVYRNAPKKVRTNPNFIALMILASFVGFIPIGVLMFLNKSIFWYLGG